VQTVQDNDPETPVIIVISSASGPYKFFNPQTFGGWNEKGLEGLKPSYRGGRPSELSEILKNTRKRRMSVNSWKR